MCKLNWYGLTPALAIGTHISVRTHGSFLTSHLSKLPWPRNGLNQAHCDLAPSEGCKKNMLMSPAQHKMDGPSHHPYSTGTRCYIETWNRRVWPPEWRHRCSKGRVEHTAVQPGAQEEKLQKCSQTTECRSSRPWSPESPGKNFPGKSSVNLK